MTGRIAVLVSTAVAVVMALRPVAPSQLQGPAATRPNIILIQADDLGYGDLGSYGQRQFATPNLDRMAREGLRFTNYYSGSTVCAPSRASLMTGLHTGHVSVRGNGEVPLHPDEVTVAMALRDAGYRTAVIGKWGLGLPGTTGMPDVKGFDRSFGFLDHRHAHRQYTDHLYRNGQRVAVDVERDYVNDLFTREALEEIGHVDARPLFVYLNYTVPHAELRVPDEAIVPFRAGFAEPTPFSNPAADERVVGYAGPSLGYRSQATPRAAFAAMVTRLDADVGRLLERLRETRQDRQTLVLFTSDNGPHREGGADPVFFGSAGRLRGIKRDLYEGGIRVPMIAWWPGTVPAGRTSDHAWAHWDFFPTAADLGGARLPPGLDGRSMAAALRGETQPAHEFMYWEFHERGFQQAVRTGRWKALRLKPGAPLELYDLAIDPGETTDVAGSEPSVIGRIEAYLRVARTSSDRWPTPAP
jgi:arylsulfatase A